MTTEHTVTSPDPVIDRRRLIALSAAGATFATPTISSSGLVPHPGAAASGCVTTVGAWTVTDCTPSMTVDQIEPPARRQVGALVDSIETTTSGQEALLSGALSAGVSALEQDVVTAIEGLSVDVEGTFPSRVVLCSPNDDVRAGSYTIDLAPTIAELESAGDVLVDALIADGLPSAVFDLTVDSVNASIDLNWSIEGLPRIQQTVSSGDTALTADPIPFSAVGLWSSIDMGLPCAINKCSDDPCTVCQPEPTGFFGGEISGVGDLTASLTLTIDLTYLELRFPPVSRSATFTVTADLFNDYAATPFTELSLQVEAGGAIVCA